MKVLVTMAGAGERFVRAGLTAPKYQLVARGKSLLEWSLSSLEAFFEHPFVFVAQKGHFDQAFVEAVCGKLGIRQTHAVLLEEKTNGQATSALQADPFLDDQESVVIFNIDTYIRPEALQGVDAEADDGVIPVFEAEGSHWSFVKVDPSGRAVEVTEKVRISGNASVGLYVFRAWADFKRVHREHGAEIAEQYKEVYVAPMYQYLIDEGKRIRMHQVMREDVAIIGTPDEAVAFDPDFLAVNKHR